MKSCVAAATPNQNIWKPLAPPRRRRRRRLWREDADLDGGIKPSALSPTSETSRCRRGNREIISPPAGSCLAASGAGLGFAVSRFSPFLVRSVKRERHAGTVPPVWSAVTNTRSSSHGQIPAGASERIQVAKIGLHRSLVVILRSKDKPPPPPPPRCRYGNS